MCCCRSCKIFAIFFRVCCFVVVFLLNTIFLYHRVKSRAKLLCDVTAIVISDTSGCRRLLLNFVWNLVLARMEISRSRRAFEFSFFLINIKIVAAFCVWGCLLILLLAPASPLRLFSSPMSLIFIPKTFHRIFHALRFIHTNYVAAGSGCLCGECSLRLRVLISFLSRH